MAPRRGGLAAIACRHHLFSRRAESDRALQQLRAVRLQECPIQQVAHGRPSVILAR